MLTKEFTRPVMWFKTAFREEAVLIRGLMSDAEWAFFELFVTAKTGRPNEYRRVLDGNL